MKKWLQKRLKNEKGLTLVELLAVIVILGIIAAIAVPSIGSLIENQRIKATKADALNAIAAAELYFVENDTKDNVSLTDLKKDGYMTDLGKLQTENGLVTKAKEDKKTSITATAKYGDKAEEAVSFTNATIESINKSGNSKTVTGTPTPTP
ncbi:prepilin-type N-terminal cleavage/methylation domain-containing protein [Sporosarcina sp. Sa2YVA2]|uniref:Prepilin-type N-terminal cleavage/methylation domain-containing protein n=1 Tax=Sporosarcina quadrami TaxID=2762234 RepID=A0ABR8U4S4_9BACL|nr:prepilin-type N-terminal cleavage/methylation domain-containing protein [Sporosarcina quadrami]MBD7983027.1 prepilin-type N-terminal cleavage/methylation domain-containing protein [Sporosarcina quadrami]